MCLPLSHPARTVRGYLYAMQLCFIVELRALRDICSVISARVYVSISDTQKENFVISAVTFSLISYAYLQSINLVVLN